VETVERALSLYGAPVYVRKQIVHNAHVVRDLEARGAVFVEDEADVPPGKTLVLSAHGVAPSVHERSSQRRLHTIDATCPLVTKVHVQARRYAAEGLRVVLIGHAGHEEVVGTMGEAPEVTVLVQSVEEAEALELPADAPVAYITQTTLSVDETTEIIDVLKRRFPHIRGPQREDICYATSNRQWAVKELLGEVDLLLVIGSRNSSNSNRLVDVARAAGMPSMAGRRRHGRRHFRSVRARAAGRTGVRLVPCLRRHRHQPVLERVRRRRLPAARRATSSRDPGGLTGRRNRATRPASRSSSETAPSATPLSFQTLNLTCGSSVR